jgi:hypothetical protein
MDIIREHELWQPLSTMDLTDERIDLFNVDTRDFHWRPQKDITDLKYSLTRASKHPENYFYTAEETKTMLQRLYEESGGPGEWRMLSLTGDAKFRTQGWQLKYLRIIRVGHIRFAVFDSKMEYLFSKHLLSCPVDQEHLGFH